MNQFTIEHDVPLPANVEARGRFPIYPLKEMKVGDSFVAPLSLYKRLASSVSQMKRRTNGEYSFIIRRSQDNQMRIWRIASKEFKSI